MEPSGTFLEYEAKAIGSGSEGAQQNLQDIYHKVNISSIFRLIIEIVYSIFYSPILIDNDIKRGSQTRFDHSQTSHGRKTQFNKYRSNMKACAFFFLENLYLTNFLF